MWHLLSLRCVWVINMKLKSLGKNYVAGTMAFWDEHLGENARKNRGKAQMYFSMRKAHDIFSSIKNNDKILLIKAGLDGDWEVNNCIIYDRDYGWKEYSKHDNSNWAKPIIIIYIIAGDSEAYECFDKRAT